MKCRCKKKEEYAIISQSGPISQPFSELCQSIQGLISIPLQISFSTSSTTFIFAIWLNEMLEMVSNNISNAQPSLNRRIKIKSIINRNFRLFFIHVFHSSFFFMFGCIIVIERINPFSYKNLTTKFCFLFLPNIYFFHVKSIFTIHLDGVQTKKIIKPLCVCLSFTHI